MKTVAKIDPEKEYDIAKKLIELARDQRLDPDNANSLDSSVDNLITTARILIEREEKRRGPKKITPKEATSKGRKKGDERKELRKLPSERFPQLEVDEKIIKPEKVPNCPCCNEIMRPSGLYDVSEKLEIIPKKYYIKRIKRPKFNCSKCHGAMVNTPSVPSIVPVSNYGDSLIIDAALSKYCDLIPMERYAQIAFRSGLDELPANSLIELTHHLANFLFPIYDMIKKEILSELVLQADETTHRMLEGDETCNWYLWGFISHLGCCFEAQNTRSGDVAFNFLKGSKAEYLVTDGYAGYSKAVREVKEKLGRKIIEVYCNAHAYRYFKEASITWKDEAEDFISRYKDIYQLEKERQALLEKLSHDEQLDYRKKMIPIFEDIKKACEERKQDTMPESSLKKAMSYFLNHYQGLTVCTTNVKIPLDNNLSERELRAPVIGRKTWLGTHSKRGAITNATLFSIVNSCKLNKINPRNYFTWIVNQIHCEKEILTPYQYSLLPAPG